ncbi:hypothetical protein JFT87_11200 [Pseudomonas sp. TH15]|nr:hypothetical protein [Pseudomonas sp. TH15]
MWQFCVGGFGFRSAARNCIHRSDYAIGGSGNGSFNVTEKWVAIIQPNFQHQITLSTNDYQISFDYS